MGAGKRAEAGLVVILILVIVVFFFGWLINISQRECKSNRDCNSESYCGSDFSCHSYPTIQKTVIQYNLFWPAVIIGIAMVIAAIIFRWSTIKPREEPKHVVEENLYVSKAPEEAEEISEPYYKNETYYKAEGNIKTP